MHQISCLELELPLLIHKGRGPATFKNFEIGGSLKKNIDTHCLFDGIVYTNVLDKYVENTYIVVVYSANTFSTPNFFIFVKNTTHDFLSHGSIKAKLSPSKKMTLIEINCYNDCPFKTKQTLFILEIFKFLFCFYDHVEKRLD